MEEGALFVFIGNCVNCKMSIQSVSQRTFFCLSFYSHTVGFGLNPMIYFSCCQKQENCNMQHWTPPMQNPGYATAHLCQTTQNNIYIKTTTNMVAVYVVDNTTSQVTPLRPC